MLTIALIAWRTSGARREALLDLFLPPIARRLLLAEWRILAVVPAGLLERRRDRLPGSAQRFSYHRRNPELAFGLAFLPAVVAESAAVHLLLDGVLPEAVRWTMLALNLYGLAWLVGFLAGLVLRPHRVTAAAVDVRFSALHGMSFAREDIERCTAESTRTGTATRVVTDGETAWFRMGGRTNVRIDLRRPARLVRPIGAPVLVRHLHLHVDAPQAFISATQAHEPGPR